MDPNMIPEQPKPQAYKSKVISEDISYEVLENGDVKVIQKQNIEFYWRSREFTSLLRQNEEALKMFKDAQSDEYIKKMADQEKQVQKVLDEIKPVAAESEKKQEKDYKKMRHKGLLSNVRAAIDDKNTNEAWFQQVWLRTKDEIKKPIFDELNTDHQAKLMKILSKMKRKGIK